LKKAEREVNEVRSFWLIKIKEINTVIYVQLKLRWIKY